MEWTLVPYISIGLMDHAISAYARITMTEILVFLMITNIVIWPVLKLASITMVKWIRFYYFSTYIYSNELWNVERGVIVDSNHHPMTQTLFNTRISLFTNTDRNCQAEYVFAAWLRFIIVCYGCISFTVIFVYNGIFVIQYGMYLKCKWKILLACCFIRV